MQMTKNQGAALNLPNALSLLRLFAIPVILVCLLFPGRLGSFLAALFFSLAFITDFLDGYLARKHGTVTALGKFLDPLADKILVCMTLIMLIPLDRTPAWMVVIIVAREIAVTGLRSAAVTEGIVIQASKLGKYKTFFRLWLRLLCACTIHTWVFHLALWGWSFFGSH
jgi:CDP-diacylglycerol---glycerol-3-phosphate 3-phosphatidyltransferase